MAEADLIGVLRAALGPAASALGSRLSLGIGDDAACLEWVGGELVVSVDAQVQGSHFDLRWLSLQDVGYRSLQAAASDLAAMAAEPVAAVAQLTLPRGFTRRRLAALAAGQARASEELGCPVIGGNLSRGGELSVVTTVIGRARRPLRRAGARPGDRLWLFGEVGLARAGLLLLSRGLARGDHAARLAVAAWRCPRAQLEAGLALRGAHAAIDVSDGLAGDAGQLAAQSGVRLVLSRAALQGALPGALTRLAARLGESALDLALTGGEDYALLVAAPPKWRAPGGQEVGRVEAGAGAWLDDGARQRRLSGGFDPFVGARE
ncbi:MAG: thiamine-phosphate kinase [Polyangiaceae bacterium]|nr:thiamine-phosphate kinase [Polyangiaceae bacterium]